MNTNNTCKPKDAAAKSQEEEIEFLEHVTNNRWSNVFDMLDQKPEFLSSSSGDCWTALCQAANAGNLVVVQRLLRLGADPLQATSNGKLPWELACGKVRGRLHTAAEQKRQMQDEGGGAMHHKLSGYPRDRCDSIMQDEGGGTMQHKLSGSSMQHKLSKPGCLLGDSMMQDDGVCMQLKLSKQSCLRADSMMQDDGGGAVKLKQWTPKGCLRADSMLKVNNGSAELRQKAPASPEEQQFFDHTKHGRWDDALMMMRQNQNLVNASPDAHLPALCQAAKSEDVGLVQRLLRLRADPSQRSPDGKTPVDFAHDGDVKRVLQDAVFSGMPSHTDAKDFEPQRFGSDFLRATMISATIGDRHERMAYRPGLGREIVSGLEAELARGLQEYDQLQPDDAKKMLDAWNNFSDLREANKQDMQSENEDLMRMAAIRAYTDESWVFSIVNRELRQKSASRKGLALFARVLHDTLSEPPTSLSRWTGAAWRWLNLTDGEVATYKYAENSLTGNVFTFPAFTSACLCNEKSVENMARFKPDYDQKQVLLKFEGSRAGPVDIRSSSMFSEEEALFPLGQTFRMKKSMQWWNAAKLAQEFSRPGYHPDPWSFAPGRNVIFLEAVEDTTAFTTLSTSFFAFEDQAIAALPALRRRLEQGKQRHGSTSDAVSKLHEVLGTALRVSGDYEGSFQELGEALTITRAELGEMSPDAAALLNHMGEVEAAQNNYDSAMELYREALQIRRAALGDRHLSVADTLGNMGNVQMRRWRLTEALQLFRSTLVIEKAVLGKRHEKMAQSLDLMANVELQLRELKAAAKQLQQSLAIFRAARGRSYLSTAQSLAILGRAEQEKELLEEVTEQIREALTVYRVALGERQYCVAIALADQGSVELRQGCFEEAVELFRLAAASFQTSLAKRRSSMVDAFKNSAEVEERCGRPHAAKELLEEAVIISRRTFGTEHKQTQECKKALRSTTKASMGSAPSH